ncbi:uncharacterized protein LOC119367386 isoform X2 [Triticum dicoccoides]|uniref:uncharacterized protein LOC119367386 isoform X2 n=1 Tax=Triticum dicoccoides TaxID=85692 RepID=UPI00188FA878|nr:uncharacterized protein LOC119367386 isoform X2 [Triticum dicoccoides]
MAHGSSASDWARDITAEDAVQPERPRGVESFRIRDASRHATRACGLHVAISHLGASCGGASSPSTAAPGQPEGSGSGRMYGILAVLSTSLALSVVSCVLCYLVGQSSEAAPSGENQDKEDLWLSAFPIGTEWENIDKIKEFNWNFQNLEKALEEGGELYGKTVYCIVDQSTFGRGWCSGHMNMLRGIIGGALRRRARWMLPTQTVHNMGESISDRPKHDHDRPTMAA